MPSPYFDDPPRLGRPKTRRLRRFQHQVSFTDAEWWVLNQFADLATREHKRRVYPGEAMMMLLELAVPDWYAEKQNEYVEHLRRELPPPLTPAEAEAERENREVEEAEYRREHGLPDPNDLKRLKAMLGRE